MECLDCKEKESWFHPGKCVRCEAIDATDELQKVTEGLRAISKRMSTMEVELQGLCIDLEVMITRTCSVGKRLTSYLHTMAVEKYKESTAT